MDINALKNFFNQLEEESQNQNENSEPIDNDVKVYKNPYEKITICKTEEEHDKESEENRKISQYKCPNYEISYKQVVTTSDIYLQMGLKNTSTASCEDMVIKIWLPNEKMNLIDLSITEDYLKLQGMLHYLNLKLPHPVDPNLGNAKWNSQDESLVVTLRMKRFLDFLNF